jgi:hypothetical protein
MKIEKKSKLDRPVMVDFRPDWVSRGTAKHIEEDLQGFRFKGPGWYFMNGDSILIVPAVRTDEPWKDTWPAKTVFTYFVWNHSEVEDSMHAIAIAPIRRDHGNIID